MLFQLGHISDDHFFELKQKLQETLLRNDVGLRLGDGMNVDSLLAPDNTPVTFPAYYTITFVSIYNNEIIGLFKAYFTECNNRVIRCIDNFMVNISGNLIKFGKDQRYFYDFLYEKCHRIELSANVDTNDTSELIGPKGAHGNTTERHFARYGVRYVGTREKFSLSYNGKWMDHMMWEIITPKGREFFNKST